MLAARKSLGYYSVHHNSIGGDAPVNSFTDEPDLVPHKSESVFAGRDVAFRA